MWTPRMDKQEFVGEGFKFTDKPIEFPDAG